MFVKEMIELKGLLTSKEIEELPIDLRMLGLQIILIPLS